ncbi:conserved protein of unknown function [Streptomyces murinus]
MSAPARPQRRAEGPLPVPELVTLLDGPTGPYVDTPEGWWTEYGGALDVRSGVVYIPKGADRPALPPCPFPCPRCGSS